MAERFIIDINVNAGSGQRTSSAGAPTDGRVNGAALAAGAGLLTSRDKKLSTLEDRLEIKANEWTDHGYSGTNYEGVALDTVEIKRGLFRDKFKAQLMFNTPAEEIAMGIAPSNAFFANYEETVRGGVVGDFYTANKTKVNAIAAATVWKTTSTIINYQNHRSGNSYANEQRNRVLTFAQQGASLAIAAGVGFKVGGPVGAGVAVAGTVINQAVNVGIQAANYNFDRKMDKLYIHNMTEVMGDISYGRSRLGK